MNALQSWSGGKDSTASIILEHELQMPPSRVVFCEVMFDHSRGISGELPEHIDWVRHVAIPRFESWGYTVDIIRSDLDYMQLFHKKIYKSKKPERNGKLYGFFIPNRCCGNSWLKVRPLESYQKSFDMIYVGIAADEPKRLARLTAGHRSILAEHGYTESMCYDLCEKYDLLSPIYTNSHRGGCWFCPNTRLQGWVYLAKHHPELYDELRKLAETPGKCSERFAYTETFFDIDQQVQMQLDQLKFFEEAAG